MGHARLAVELLTHIEPDRARKIADYLAQQNAQRQRVERAITAEAVEMVQSQGLDEAGHCAIVLGSDGWHGGVIGIVASRIVDRFNRPTVLVAFNEQGGQGSARTAPGFHMRDALAACAEHLKSFGGHAMAGGLRVEADKFGDFAKAFGAYVRVNLPDERLIPTLAIDAETTLAALHHNVASHLARLAPHGQGNPPPLVVVRGCELLTAPQRMGRSGSVVGMVLRQGEAKMRAVGFGMGDLADSLVGISCVDVVAQPTLNHFNGNTSVELQLRDVRWGQ